jgi:hypothetical protein
MLFGRKKKMFKQEQEVYWDCTGEWYFKIEYYEDFSTTPSYMYFESLRDAEYWARTDRHASYILCLTDRQGNRIITNWTGFTGGGAISSWTNSMGRQVLDLREGHNDLWVPQNSKRAKNAKEWPEV